MRSVSGLFGYTMVVVFIYVAITKVTSNPALFLNLHGIGLVVGGLFIAGFASFPWQTLKSTLITVIKHLYTKGKVNPQVAEELVKMAAAFHKGLIELDIFSKTVDHRFMKEAVNLVLEGLPREFISDVLEKRINEDRLKIQTEMNVLMTISKYSPAMGLAATVLGLVDLLQKLSRADLGEMGVGMAVALSATFYGIILANMVFAPMSELVATAGEFQVKEDEMVRQGVEAMMEKKNPLMVGELVNSYLASEDRINFTEKMEVLGKSKVRASA